MTLNLDKVDIASKTAPVQTAISNDYCFVVSYWFRKHLQLPIENIVDFIAKWPESAKICFIENLWRGESESRYGFYWSHFYKRKNAILSTNKHHWKQVPVPYSPISAYKNAFYFQHIKTETFLCFAADGSHNICLYDIDGDSENNGIPIKVVLSNIRKVDEKFVYEKNKIKSTFYFRNMDNLKHLAFRGFNLGFYPENNVRDLTPWLCHYIYDKNIRQQNRRNMVLKWLQSLDVDDEYFEIFTKNGFDRMELILEMNEAELKQIGVQKVGHIKLLKDDIDKMRKEAYSLYVKQMTMSNNR